MRKLLQLLIIIMLTITNVFAQFERLSHPQFYDEEKTDYLFKPAIIDSTQLDSIIIDYKNSLSIPGISTMIIKDNQIVWNKNYGYRNLQYQLPVEDSTIFLIVSISKIILATAVMQLWENGLINLENNINNYLPTGFTVANPRFPNDSITVKMLMTHTSSILDNGAIVIPLISCGDSPISLDSFLVNYLTPGGAYYSLNNYGNYRPGEQWNYSNPGSAILGLIVENLAGKSFDQYCKDSIFIPLSMNSASWFLAGMDTNQIATPYVGSTPICHQGWPHYPIGFLRTNKIDLSKFLMAYMNNGIYNNVRILDSTTISYMLSDQLGYPANWLSPWWIWKQGLIWWNPAGNWDGYLTFMCYDPSEKWGTIFFQNKHTRSSNPLFSLFGEINNHFTNYAYLYGNIYALHSSVDKAYAKVNVDSVLFRTRFSNIYNHPFTPHLIYANTDSSIIDSLTLFDDGLHGDSLANDGIYGGYIPSQQNENFYSMGVSTIDNQSNKYFITPDICRFTTAGPVVLDSISCNKLNIPVRTYAVKPYIKNLSNTVTITQVKIKLISNDSWVEYVSQALLDFPNIPPLGTVSPSASFTVRYIDSLFPGYFNFKIEVLSDGWVYWTDSMQVIVTEIEDEKTLPTEYALLQNYPNPFNPSTKISWQSPVGSHQTIKVYDVLGNEVATLVDEYKPAGKYEIEFDASRLASGIYFYQLRAGEYVAVKKMILIK